MEVEGDKGRKREIESFELTEQSVSSTSEKNTRLLESLFVSNIVWGTYVWYLVKNLLFGTHNTSSQFKKNNNKNKENWAQESFKKHSSYSRSKIITYDCVAMWSAWLILV